MGITITGDLINKARPWLKTAWTALPGRRDDLPYNNAASCQLEALNIASENSRFPFIEGCSENFTSSVISGNTAMCEQNVWGNDSTKNDLPTFHDFPHDMRLNISVLTLAA